MGKKLMSWKTKGMNRDLSVSAFNPEFAFENMNLRLSTNEGNTLMSWVNEKGTETIELVTWDSRNSDTPESSSIEGFPIGTAVIDHTVVLFTTTNTDSYKDPDKTDCIYLLTLSNDKQKIGVKQLYKGNHDENGGNLNFSTKNPIETLVSYESEDVKKVYWVDVRNQPRVINIEKETKPNNPTQFDFLPKLQLNEEVTVNKIVGGTGQFAPGVIQYAFTYYNQFAQESNIFYVSPLRYISPKNRGAAADEMIDNTFEIIIKKVDTNFDFLRIYSIQRTSINGTPITKRVQDIELKNLEYVDPGDHSKGYKIRFIDTGTVGDSIDPTELLFKNKGAISVGTIDQKDLTLFLGNIKTKNDLLHDSLVYSGYYVNNHLNTNNYELETEFNECILPNDNNAIESDYPYINQLTLGNSEGEYGIPCSGFRAGNTYRLGVQFQDKTGSWTEPFFIKDYPVPFTFIKNNTTYDTRPTIVTEGGVLKLKLPRIECKFNHSLTQELLSSGYVKVRPLVVLPTERDRKVVCQSVVCPTVFTQKMRDTDHSILGQSSWFFRPILPSGKTSYLENDVLASPKGEHFSREGQVIDTPYSAVTPGTPSYKDGVVYEYLPYTKRSNSYNPMEDHGEPNDNKKKSGEAAYKPDDTPPQYPIEHANDIRQVEIQGHFNAENRFAADRDLITLHSPDIEFNDKMYFSNFENTEYQRVGYVGFERVLSDIDIQTETPTVDGNSGGFIHKSFKSVSSCGIIGGLFYDDYALDDYEDTDPEKTISKYDQEKSPYKWLVYPWHRTGSLNNDISRPSNLGVQTAFLKKKVISNLRITNTTYEGINSTSDLPIFSPQFFNGEDNSVLRLNYDGKDAQLYYGNVDTILNPDKGAPIYLSFGSDTFTDREIDTPFECKNWWRLFEEIKQNNTVEHGLQHWEEDPDDHEFKWVHKNSSLGTSYQGIVLSKDSVRMKYKSSAHLVSYIDFNSSTDRDNLYIPIEDYFSLPVIEMRQQTINNIFGGTSADALKANVWIPCGKPRAIGNDTNSNHESITKFNFNYGDTYYQRYDCLKTYAYTPEDINQVIEIGSFMLESYINIDGRYDRNRGQLNNLNMSPQNFNLINPVYSQTDNFFSYKITNTNTEVTGQDLYQEEKLYPNIITWTKNKENESNIDLWTDLTLASTLEMDGNVGDIQKIIRLNNQLLCFQDKGISQILYNESTQISSTEGMPIEIANSGKVQGKKYLSNTIGCSNKWSIATTPAGIYFMDSNNKSIYLFNGQLNNLSLAGGFNTWSKQNIPASDMLWHPDDFGDDTTGASGNFVAYYDPLNQDVLFINKKTCLAYSEKLGVFTSFYDYEDTPYFASLDDVGLWIKGNITETPDDPETVEDESSTTYSATIWKHQGGDYCRFFGENKPYWMTMVGNPEPQTDKTFTNLEFRACVEGDGAYVRNTDKFTPALPFDSLETWDEYQHGYTTLENKNGHDAMIHGGDSSALKRKFRMWRCDIPRDNVPVVTLPDDPTPEEIAAYNAFIKDEREKGITRFKNKPLDRMRNPWLYLKLMKNTPDESGGTTVNMDKVEIHDLVMTYFN